MMMIMAFIFLTIPSLFLLHNLVKAKGYFGTDEERERYGRQITFVFNLPHIFIQRNTGKTL